MPQTTAASRRTRLRALQVGLTTTLPGVGGAPIRFCETNPPFWRQEFYVSFVLQDTYVVCRGFLQVGSFWKTNPPEGCFGGHLVGKWVRFGKTKPRRTPRENGTYPFELELVIWKKIGFGG